MLYYVAVWAGATAAALYDPLVWVLMGFTAMVALARPDWRILVMIAVGSFIVRYAISANNRALLGEPDSFMSTLAGLAGVTCVMAAHGLALMLRAMWRFRRPVS